MEEQEQTVEFTTESPKRRGRPPNALRAQNAAVTHDPEPAKSVERDYNEITYIPGNNDPTNTIVDFDPSRPTSGLRFSANLPVKVKKSRTITQLIVHKKTNVDGNVVTYTIETKKPVDEVLRNNPNFSINGEKPVQQQVMAVRYDPDWYRGYAQKWIVMSTNLRVMNERWDQEDKMRTECGCNFEDESYLQPQLEYMRKRLTVDI